jgi:hypothetical protein
MSIVTIHALRDDCFMATLIGISPAILAAIGLWWVWRYYSIPQSSVFLQIRQGLPAIQRYAIDNIYANSKPSIESRFAIRDVLTFVYTVNEVDGKIIHTISGKLHRWRPKRWLIACMLIVIMEFERQLKFCCIENEPGMKALDEAPTGTIYIRYTLTPEQHGKLVSSIGMQQAS